MFTSRFGIEIECSGITRERAAYICAELLGGTVRYEGGSYSEWHVTAPDQRVWKFVYDSSIVAVKKEGRQLVPADSEYKVEMVSPILTYREDIETVQELVRRIRKAGGVAGKTCGCHIHLDGAPHTPKSIRNFVNIIASRNELFYKSLQIEPERMSYCKKMDTYMVQRLNQKKPKTFQQIADIW